MSDTTQKPKPRRIMRSVTVDWRTEEVPKTTLEFVARRTAPCLHGWAFTTPKSLEVLMTSCYLQACEDVVQALEAKGVDLSVLDGYLPAS